MFGAQALDVIFNIFRIGGDDRAVVVVACLRKLGALIRDARVENVFDAFFYKPLDVSVCELCRIAFRFTRDGFDTEFIDFPGRSRGEYDPILQVCKGACF